MNPTDVYLYRVRHFRDGELELEFLTHNNDMAEHEAQSSMPDLGLETLVTIVTLPRGEA